jgi:naphthalene 1,2-dioxygenase system ferredoxin subunit
MPSMSTALWVDAMSTADLSTDDVIGVIVGGRDIAIFTVGDAVYATENLCTHGHARLCDGFLDGHEIECPLHQGKFDVRDGRPTCAPVTEAIRSYPIRIDGERVVVQVD